MSDVMVVVDRKNWRYEQREAGRDFRVGDVLDWRSYVSGNGFIARYLEHGDRLFLVKATGERLWLVAVYDGVRLSRRNDNGDYVWKAKNANNTPIIDITKLRNKLRFHTGNGITSKPGVLGSALQTPRMLTDYDIDLINAEIRGHGGRPAPSGRVSLDIEADEGIAFIREVTLYKRDPALVLDCLKRDRHTCRHCGFVIDTRRFPKLAVRLRARIVQVHHVRPVSWGKRRGDVADLVTLCPTCHAVAHALGAVTDAEILDLDLLRKHYRPHRARR